MRITERGIIGIVKECVYKVLDEAKSSKYQCLNEAKSSIGGMMRNGLPRIGHNPYRIIMSEGIQYEPDSKQKGGIIVFSTDVNAVKLDPNRLKNWIKQKAVTLKNRFSYSSKIDKIADKHSLVGWTIGRFLDGRYKAKNGKIYGESSLSLEIIGISFKELITIAEELCASFKQESVLVKDFTTGRILFVDPSNAKITENRMNTAVKGSIHRRIGSLDNVPRLNEVYESTNNESAIVPINETNARRLLDRHTADGYAIISACRGKSEFSLGDSVQDTQRLNSINAQRTRELINDIQKRGFSYTLSYGGFIENLGTEAEEHVYERSVIVYAQKRNGETDPRELFDFAIAECGKFNQDSVLIKMPDDTPKYYKKDGKVDYVFRGDVAFNDVAQEYFTDLHKNTEKKINLGAKPTRFSFSECYIAPKPQCYSESHVRSLKGEIFLKR